MPSASVLLAAGMTAVAGVAGQPASPLFELHSLSPFALRFVCIEATLDALNEKLNSGIAPAEIEKYIMGLPAAGTATSYTDCSGAFDFAKTKLPGKAAVDATKQKILRLVSSAQEPWKTVPTVQEIARPDQQILSKVLRPDITVKMMRAALSLRAAKAVQARSDIRAADALTAQTNFLNGLVPFKDQEVSSKSAKTTKKRRRRRRSAGTEEASSPVYDFPWIPMTLEQLRDTCVEALFDAFREDYGERLYPLDAAEKYLVLINEPVSQELVYVSCLEAQSEIVAKLPHSSDDEVMFLRVWNTFHFDEEIGFARPFPEEPYHLGSQWDRNPTVSQVSWPKHSDLEKALQKIMPPMLMKAFLALQAARDVKTKGMDESDHARTLIGKLIFLDEAKDWEFNSQALFQKIDIAGNELRRLCLEEAMNDFLVDFPGDQRIEGVFREYLDRPWDGKTLSLIEKDCNGAWNEALKFVTDPARKHVKQTIRSVASGGWNGMIGNNFLRAAATLNPGPGTYSRNFNIYRAQEMRAALTYEAAQDVSKNGLAGVKALELKSKLAFTHDKPSPLRRQFPSYTFAEVDLNPSQLAIKCVRAAFEALRCAFGAIFDSADERTYLAAALNQEASDVYLTCVGVFHTKFVRDAVGEERHPDLYTLLRRALPHTHPGKNPFIKEITQDDFKIEKYLVREEYLPRGVTNGQAMKLILALQAARQALHEGNTNGSLIKQLTAKLDFMSTKFV